jgi:hypothetical protein
MQMNLSLLSICNNSTSFCISDGQHTRFKHQNGITFTLWYGLLNFRGTQFEYLSRQTIQIKILVLQAGEIKFMRKAAGFTFLDLKRNKDIFKKLEVEPVSKFIQNYRANRTDHV